MAHFPFILLLVYLPMLAFGQRITNDPKFCHSFFPASVGAPEYKDFFLYSNVKFMKESSNYRESGEVRKEFWFYSKDLQTMKTYELYPHPHISYTDAKHDLESNFDVYGDVDYCNTEIALQDYYVHKVQKIITHSGNFTELTPLKTLLQWNNSNVIYQVHDRRFIGYAEVRGIPCAVWITCGVDVNERWSNVIKWYFSDATKVEMPAGKEKILIRKEYHYPSSNYTMTYDYAMFQPIPQENLVTTLERPDTVECNSRRTWIPPPRMPEYFSFQGEQFITFTTSSGPKQYLRMYEETYDFENQLFVMTGLEKAGARELEEEAAITIVNDFNTGISYYLNPNENKCTMSNGIHDRVSEIGVAGGFVKMKTPKQFFEFDSDKYQYTGLHMVRGFECNAWTVRFDDRQLDHDQNTTRIWYFMTSAQMQKLQYPEHTPPRPMRLLVFNKEFKRVFDIFQFRTKRTTSVPVNIGLCYRNERPQTVRLALQGNLSAEVLQKGSSTFRRAFLRDIQGYARIGTPLRISNLQMRSNPTNSKEFYVEFNLYRRIPKGGNVKFDKDYLETDEALKLLKKQIDNSKVTVGVYYSRSDIVYLTARPGSLMVMDNQGMFQKFDSSRNGTVTRATSGVTSGSKANPGSKGSSGYSSGSMAGIGIGMSILGLILGAGGVYLFKRSRGTGVASHFRMSDVRKNADA